MITRLVLMFALLLAPVQAQEAPHNLITRETVTRLQSVQYIDFEATGSYFQSGWFAMNDTATQFAVADSDQAVWYIADGTFTRFEPPAATGDLAPYLSDTAFGFDSFISVYTDGQTFYLSHHGYPSAWSTLPLADNHTPISVWYAPDTQQAWLETQDFMTGLSHILPYQLAVTDKQAQWQPLAPVVYAPATDTEAVVRMGRIPLPYAVTSSEAGLVKLWNVQTGDLLAQAETGLDKPAVFGYLNANKTHLVWRDNLNETLYLLDFETGQNRTIAQLNGEYMQWLFLTPQADLALGVLVNFEPVIVAWDTQTGERFELGRYRDDCPRPPDIARLSVDGSALVIGCSAGLEVWRVGD